VKYIIAAIQPDRLEDVLEQLEEREVHLVTVSDVMGRGRQMGAAEIYRSHVEPGNLLRKVKLEIAVNDDYLEPALGAVCAGAHTGKIGDGKVFLLDLEQCLRIRTGETGSVAIG
jgi:nitrogen regulatory protein P-II 1